MGSANRARAYARLALIRPVVQLVNWLGQVILRFVSALSGLLMEARRASHVRPNARNVITQSPALIVKALAETQLQFVPASSVSTRAEATIAYPALENVSPVIMDIAAPAA